MAKKISVGILGGGGILAAHAPAYAQITDMAEVVAVAEPNPERAEPIRKMFGAHVRIEKDYRDVTGAPDVDAVDIILPHHLHLPATLAAAAGRKPVLVEKVMGRTVAECEQMQQACEQARVPLVVCHDRRYDAQWQALQRVVASGALGPIHFWHLEHCQDVDPIARNLQWVRSVEKVGGGAIMSCLTHQIDALRWMGGEAQRVACMTKVIPERMAGETVGAITAQMRSGALAQLTINWHTRASSGGQALWYELTQVCGALGEAYFMSGRGTFVRLHQGDVRQVPGCENASGAEFVPVAAQPCAGHLGCIREWVRMLRGEAHAVTTWGQDACKTVAFAEAAYRSVETGRFVDVAN